MVGTIGFAGSRARDQGRYRQWGTLVGVHVLGSALGGGAVGLVVGFLGAAFARATVVTPRGVVAGILLAFAALDIVGAPASVVSRARQVPMSWKHVFPARMSSTMYGLTLGSGVASTIYFWSAHATLIAAFLLGVPGLGLIAGAAFGIGRSAPVIVSSFIDSDSGTQHFADILTSSKRFPLRIASAASIAAVALVLVVRP